jgi:hypothetical protein
MRRQCPPRHSPSSASSRMWLRRSASQVGQKKLGYDVLGEIPIPLQHLSNRRMQGEDAHRLSFGLIARKAGVTVLKSPPLR